MLSGPSWFALEVKYLDRARSFYEAFLELDVREEREQEVALAAGETDLILRRPTQFPRGGLHTHYALSIPAGEYDRWYDRLDERFDLAEHEFGDTRSLYFYDTESNCVELTQTDQTGSGISGVFEVVLEVERLDRSVPFYESLGFDPVDRGDDRDRVRLEGGDFALELWEPHLGISDARGGVHVDLGITTADPAGVTAQARSDALAVEESDDAVRLRDPDGHYLTFVRDA